MTHAEQLAAFIVRASYEEVFTEARQQLKIRILDALGCAIGALERNRSGTSERRSRILVAPGGLPSSGVAGQPRTGRRSTTAPWCVTWTSTTVIWPRAKRAIRATTSGLCWLRRNTRNRSGRELLTALAVAYQVQCRLSDVAPVRARGFDHTTQGSYAVAAGVSKALGLDKVRTANAIAICGTAFNALRVTRTGALSHWKGLAYPNTAFCCTHATFLAMRGITGPLEVFEGNKGFMEAIAGPVRDRLVAKRTWSG